MSVDPGKQQQPKKKRESTLDSSCGHGPTSSRVAQDGGRVTTGLPGLSCQLGVCEWLSPANAWGLRGTKGRRGLGEGNSLGRRGQGRSGVPATG